MAVFRLKRQHCCTGCGSIISGVYAKSINTGMFRPDPPSDFILFRSAAADELYFSPDLQKQPVDPNFYVPRYALKGYNAAGVPKVLSNPICMPKIPAGQPPTTDTIGVSPYACMVTATGCSVIGSTVPGAKLTIHCCTNSR